jgi:hypothetical protein
MIKVHCKEEDFNGENEIEVETFYYGREQILNKIRNSKIQSRKKQIEI